MSWIRNRTSLSRRLALAALLATAATAAGADVLVVRSTGPSAASYPAGRSLPDNARITLRNGDTVVVLDARGTRTYRGPGNFAAASAQSGVRTAETNGRRARIGAVRSAGFVATSPTTIWHVDVSQGGNMCVANANSVMLWRPEASQTATLAISGPGGVRTVQWPAGRTTVSWPADLPIANGGAYQLRQAGTAVPTTITFRVLDAAPAGDLQSVANALIRNDCQEQLDLLVDSAPSG